MTPIYRTIRKPVFSVHKRRPKDQRKKVAPLFWLEPHLCGPDLRYIVLYVPGRLIVLGWSVRREVEGYTS